jgi:hypothetical protein
MVEPPQGCQAKVYGSVTLASRPQDRLDEQKIQDAGWRICDMADQLDREFRSAG